MAEVPKGLVMVGADVVVPKVGMAGGAEDRPKEGRAIDEEEAEKAVVMFAKRPFEVGSAVVKDAAGWAGAVGPKEVEIPEKSPLELASPAAEGAVDEGKLTGLNAV
eukprot:Sspe_Gene.59795::Locus_32875_Transcript_1_1_Confidence_1.000_Length_847::g.59795::m.59795